jgi:hypothetical protein
MGVGQEITALQNPNQFSCPQSIPNPPMNETNPYLRRLEALNEARKKWNESEWLLNLLRTRGSEKPKQLDKEELLQWAQKSR